MTCGLPPISSSWRQAPRDSRPQIFFLWLYSIWGLGRLHENFRFTSVTRSTTVGTTPWTGDQLLARPLPVHKLNKHYAMKTSGGVHIQIHIFLISVLVGRWVVSFTPLSLYTRGLDRRLGGPQSRSGRGGENWSHRDSNSDSSVVYPVISRYPGSSLNYLCKNNLLCDAVLGSKSLQSESSGM
jgi:hypothetical protein